MPELPEVETVVRGLTRHGLIGKVIEEALVYWPRTVAEPGLAAFKQNLKSQVISGVYRRAKYIVISLSNGAFLLVHLRMTGRIDFSPREKPRNPHEHILINFSDGTQLRFQDTRKFGRWILTYDPGKFLNKIGPEPFSPEFTVSWLETSLKKHARMLKPLLLDQTFLAGLGNIYVDEALWDAKLHPEMLSNRLKIDQVKCLRSSIVKVLKRGVENMGTSLGQSETNFYSVAKRRGRNQDKLKVFRRDGEECPRCKTVIVRKVIAQRSSHLCPACQRAPRPKN